MKLFQTFYDDGVGYRLVFFEKFIIEPECDWLQFYHLSSMNWVTFRFCHIELEWDRLTRYFKVYCILFGLGARIRLDCGFERSEIKKLVDEAYEEIEREEKE